MNKISIIILWWSRTSELEKMAQDCLQSVLENTIYPSYEVIIIENQSIHPSEFLRSFKDERVKIYFQEENLGFVKGNNVGIDIAEPNDVLLLNNDTVVPKGWLTPIMSAVNMYPDLAMVMPVQMHKGSKEFFEADGDYKKLVIEMGEAIERNTAKNSTTQMIEGNWLPLCATVITRKALNKVGKLDEEFGLGGFEDVDYSWRCLDAGLNLYLCGNSNIFHHYGQSFHFHEGLAEVWVDKGKYLLEKHNATQTVDDAVYRLKDKSIGWFEKNMHKVKEKDLEAVSKIVNTGATND